MNAEKFFTEYPRPQLKRKSYFNLNGKWILNGEEIIVPFPPQSKISGYKRKVGKHLEYVKKFVLPKDFEEALFSKENKNRIILHFGAVDQIAQLSVDGNFVGTHFGGYLPFSFDITDYLSKNLNHEIRMEVKDSLNHKYPYGKQKKKSGGMWYTPVSGIWQTVWMEVVPETYISKIKINPNMKGFELFVETTSCKVSSEEKNYAIKVKVYSKGEKVYQFVGTDTYLKIELPISDSPQEFSLWSVESPNLYDFSLELFSSEEEITMDKKPLDKIYSYFGLREISVKKTGKRPGIYLNEKPIFFHGVLDQGYFFDGIFLPKTEEGFRNDIKNMKELGINTLRKHIKIEPDIFYYECDKLGILVMQDMVNNGSYNFIRDTAFPTVFGDFGKRGKKRHNEKKEPKTQKEIIFVEHSKETIEHLFNHPCVVYYTIFNEGWGQFKANYVYEYLKSLDTTRIFDTASGWFKNPESDVESEHIYFKTPSVIEKANSSKKPLIISECGGYTLRVENHIWNPKKSYGYGACKSISELTEKIANMYEKMIIPAIKHGLCGCVYTQLSDVEEEINGFYTYDRKKCKVEKSKMQEIQKNIYASLQEISPII